MRLPLEERRIALEDVITGTRVMRSEPLPGTPLQIEAAVRKLKLEGVVAKRRDSQYEPGKRGRASVKVKFNRRQEFVIGGFKPNATNFESLLVGYYQGAKLHFASKVRAGLTRRMYGPNCFSSFRKTRRRAVHLRTCQAAKRAIGVRASRRRTWRRCAG
jgi:bifunctional non-homologous end joining protein LigD